MFLVKKDFSTFSIKIVGAEDCLVTNYSPLNIGQWDDVSCFSFNKFVCIIPKGEPQNVLVIVFRSRKNYKLVTIFTCDFKNVYYSFC